MSELVFRPAVPEDLERTVELMGLGFPAAHKFSRAFLQWQYYDNPAGAPLGCNSDDGERLIGHLMGIPLNVRLHGAPAVATLIMNVATHPDYRGRGLFLELVRRVSRMSAERGHAGVVGVATSSRAGLPHQTRLQNVGLGAHVTLAQSVDIAAALTAAGAHRWWMRPGLGEESGQPAHRGGTADNLVVESLNPPLIRARGVIPRDGPRPCAATWGTAVVLGLTPKRTARRAGVSRAAAAVAAADDLAEPQGAGRPAGPGPDPLQLLGL